MAKAGIKIKLNGLNELSANLEKIAKGLSPDVVEDILYAGAEVFVAAAKAKVPKKTGKLRDAIIAKKLARQGNKPAPVLYTIDRKKAPAAYLVEFGSSGKVRIAKRGKFKGKSYGVMPKRPYFRPALDENADRVGQMITERLKAAVEGAVS